MKTEVNRKEVARINNRVVRQSGGTKRVYVVMPDGTVEVQPLRA